MYLEGEAPSGLITAVEVQKKDPDRVSICIGGEFAFGVHTEVARRFELGCGLELPASTAAAALKADAAHRAFNAAMSLLSHRARTEFEMRQRLSRKGFNKEAVDDAIRRLHDRAYLDDRGFAREYASSRVTSRGEGLHRIRGDLLKRGIDRGIVDEVTSELQPKVDWTEIARKQAQKRWERIRNKDDERRRRKKMLDFLVRKGFDHSTALTVIAGLEEG